MHPTEKSRRITEVCDSLENSSTPKHKDRLSDLRHFSFVAGVILYLAGTYLILNVLTSQSAFMGTLTMTWRAVLNCSPPPQEAQSRH